jgi:hypothetical protein
MIVRLHNTIFITTNIINQNNMFRREPLSGSRFALFDSFQKFYERCQPCVVKDDDYFEDQ